MALWRTATGSFDPDMHEQENYELCAKKPHLYLTQVHTVRVLWSLDGNRLSHYVWARHLGKSFDTLMTRNVELLAHVSSFILCLIHVTVLPETHAELVYHESEEDLKTYKDFARCLLIFLALYQAPILHTFLWHPKLSPGSIVFVQ